MGKRESGTIIDTWTGVEDHGITTTWITIKFDEGGQQGFGGLILDAKTNKDFIQKICKLFYVTDLKELHGKKCNALFSFGRWNETMEGLENSYGERFTLYSFRKKHWPDDVKNPFDAEKERLQKEVERHQAAVKEARERIKKLKAGYTDWSK